MPVNFKAFNCNTFLLVHVSHAYTDDKAKINPDIHGNKNFCKDIIIMAKKKIRMNIQGSPWQ